jgi:hypothetical protein
MDIYLAGTISEDPKHLEWRTLLTETFKNTHHTIVSPMRFQNPEQFTKDGLHDKSVPDSFFVATDYSDVANADVVFLVYWKNSPGKTFAEVDSGAPCCKERRQSIGTWAEFGIATFLHIPTIVVTDDPDVADHPFSLRKSAIVCETVEEGLSYLRKALK